MGKIVLCSKYEKYSLMKSNITDFIENATLEGVFGYLCTYSKLNIVTQNVYISSNGDYVAGVGTFIYKGKIGIEALKEILSSSLDISVLQEEILGSYCIAIYKNEVMTIFVDATATYNIFYHLDENSIILTNTFYHVALCLEEIGVNTVGFIGNWLLNTVDDSTPIKGVKKLLGNQYLYFNGTWSAVKLCTISHMANTDWLFMIMDMYKALPSLFRQFGVFMTGGQDSRLVLSLLLALKAQPTLYYGVGNSLITVTKKKDMDIVYDIANTFSLPVQIMNWADSNMTNDVHSLKKYGELYMIYNANKNIFNEFEKNISVDLLLLGSPGEVYRIEKKLEQYPHATCSLLQYVEDLYLDGVSRLFTEEGYQLYVQQIYGQFLNIAKDRELDSEHLSKSDMQILDASFRLRWDMSMYNFANQFVYSFPLMVNIRLLSYVENISYEKRLHSKFIIECIEQLFPELLSIPFFSRIKEQKYNEVTHELKDKNVSSNYKDVIKKYIHSKYIIKLLRYAYYLLQGDNKGIFEIQKEYKLREYYWHLIIDEYNDIDLIDMSKIQNVCDAKDISRLAQYIFIIKNLLNR